MQTLSRWALAGAVLALTTATASAQERRGFGGGFGGHLFLLGQKSVQEELKLSEDQTAKVKELEEKNQAAMRELRKLEGEERRTKTQEQNKAAEKAIAEVLKPEQVKRLKEISLQQRGGLAFAAGEVAETLKLTDEQKEKVKGILEESSKATRELFQNAGGNREEARKKGEELRKTTREKLTGVLTDEQKAKWKELTGEPFKGEIRFAPRRRPSQD